MTPRHHRPLLLLATVLLAAGCSKKQAPTRGANTSTNNSTGAHTTSATTSNTNQRPATTTGPRRLQAKYFAVFSFQGSAPHARILGEKDGHALLLSRTGEDIPTSFKLHRINLKTNDTRIALLYSQAEIQKHYHFLHASGGLFLREPFPRATFAKLGALLHQHNVTEAVENVIASPTQPDLLFRAGLADDPEDTRRWFRHQGDAAPTQLAPEGVSQPRMDPTGKYLAVELDRKAAHASESRLAIIDTESLKVLKLHKPIPLLSARWAPDGSALYGRWSRAKKNGAHETCLMRWTPGATTLERTHCRTASERLFMQLAVLDADRVALYYHIGKPLHLKPAPKPLVIVNTKTNKTQIKDAPPLSDHSAFGPTLGAPGGDLLLAFTPDSPPRPLALNVETGEARPLALVDHRGEPLPGDLSRTARRVGDALMWTHADEKAQRLLVISLPLERLAP